MTTIEQRLREIEERASKARGVRRRCRWNGRAAPADGANRRMIAAAWCASTQMDAASPWRQRRVGAPGGGGSPGSNRSSNVWRCDGGDWPWRAGRLASCSCIGACGSAGAGPGGGCGSI